MSHLRPWLRACRVFAIVLFLCGLCSRADTEVFEIRTSAPLFGRTLTQTENVDFTSWQVGTFAFSQSWNGQAGVREGYATLPGIKFDLNAYNHFTFSLSDSDLRCAIGPMTIQDARSAGHVIWLDFKPEFTGPATWSFMVHSDLVGHALGVAQPAEGGGPPVVSPLFLGSDWFSAYSLEGGGSPFYGVRAAAPVDPAKPFWVVDFNLPILLHLTASRRNADHCRCAHRGDNLHTRSGLL